MAWGRMVALLTSIMLCGSFLASPSATIGATNRIAANTCGSGYFAFMDVSGWYSGSRACVATSVAAVLTSCPAGSTQRPYFVNPAFESGKAPRTEKIRIYRWIINMPSDFSVQFQTSNGISFTSTKSALFQFSSTANRFTSTQVFPEITYKGGGTKPGTKAQAVAISLWEHRWVYDWQQICVTSGKPVAVLTNSGWRAPTGLSPVWKADVGDVNQALSDSLRFDTVASGVVTPNCPTSSNLGAAYFQTIGPGGTLPITAESDVSWGTQFAASYGQAQFGLSQSFSRTQTLTVTFKNSSKFGRRLCVDTAAISRGNFSNLKGTGETTGTVSTPVPGLIIGIATSN